MAGGLKVGRLVCGGGGRRGRAGGEKKSSPKTNSVERAEERKKKSPHVLTEPVFRFSCPRPVLPTDIFTARTCTSTIITLEHVQ
jgi:hypothetical protein